MDITDVEKQLFIKYYSKLLNTIQIDSLLPDLFTNKVITFDQKQNYGSNESNLQPKRRLEKLLDEVIYRSLGTNCSLFDELLYAMQNSQDRLSKQLAEDILAEKYPQSSDSKLTTIYRT